MTKKIAIPMENGKLCAHFGQAAYFVIATVQDGQVVETIEKTPPAHEPGSYPRWIASLGVTDVIAGGMGQKAIDLFRQQGIQVFAGAPIKNEKEIVEDFLSGKLTLDANFCQQGDNHAHRCSH
jgi:predicted Fe-Mo cluster-binding NifX family protein